MSALDSSSTCSSTTCDGAGCPVPLWASRLEVPVWVCDGQRRLRWLNDRAMPLFDGPAGVLTRPCFEVVAGRDEAGCRFCTTRCAPIETLSAGGRLADVTLEVGTAGRRRWVRTLLIPLVGPSGELALVHCGLDAQRCQRLVDHARRIAARSAALADADANRRRPLSDREFEILVHLSRDEDVPTIARRLFISVATVRNHVQHLLAALGAHSVVEAVARYLLDPESLKPASVDRDLGQRPGRG